MTNNEKALTLMTEWFGHDTLLSVATMDGDRPSVRIVNAYYEDGAFYSITEASSNKMQQIKRNANVAVCGDCFSMHGIGENIGQQNSADNASIMSKLRTAFADWYENGQMDENHPNSVILKIRLTDGVLWHDGERFEIIFPIKED
jgi:general stress protein 26